MELRQLIDRLPGCTVALSTRFPDVPIYGVAFLTLTSQPIRGDILYFGDTTVMPAQLPPNTPFSCVILGPGDPPDRLVQTNNCNFFHVDESIDPFDCFNHAQALLIDDRELAGATHHMLDALFSDKGLQHLVEVASEALGNPVLVVDPSYHYIARHVGQIQPDDDSRFAVVMREELEYQAVLEEGIAFIRANDLERRLRRGNAVQLYNDNLGANCVMGAVMVRGIRVANAMMVERTRPITPVMVGAFEQLLGFIGQEYQKDTVHDPNRGEAYGHFLMNLLEEEQPSPAMIDHRLKAFDFTPLGLYYVAVIKPRDACFTPTGYDLVTDRIDSVLSHNIWARYDGSLVILFNRRPEKGLGIYTEAVLRDAAEENSLYCGISNSFTDLSQIRMYYEQAASVIDLGVRYVVYSHEECCFHYSDYSYIELFDMASNHKNVANYCRPEILRLKDYDDRHKSDLMNTLFAFLQCAGNTSATAQVLNVHKNTLLYRMGRIRQIINNDLTSGEDMFMFHLSFRALIFLGSYAPTQAISSIDVHKKSDAHIQEATDPKE